MKKAALVALLLIALPLRVLFANTEDVLWDKAINHVNNCFYQQLAYDCLILFKEADTLVKGKDIQSNVPVVTKKRNVGFFEVTASVTVIPYENESVTFVFSGADSYEKCRIWSGFNLAVLRMKSKPKSPVSVTAYVPKGSSVTFARVNGKVVIKNRHLLNNIVKKATQNTTFILRE